MADLIQAYATRDFMLRRLTEDLMGGADERRLTESPTSRFVVGVLFPEITDSSGPASSSGERVPESVEDDVEVESETESGGDIADGGADPGVSLARVRHPRSMGMTFGIDSAQASVEITVNASEYRPLDDRAWERFDLDESVHVVHLAEVELRHRDVVPGLQLVTHVREPDAQGFVYVTATLVNTRSAPRGERDGACWFAPTLRARPVGGKLVERPPVTVAGSDEAELASQRLLFRDVRSFGVGHGCAVVWEGEQPDLIATTFLPQHELLLSEAAGGEGLDLSMDALAADDRFEVLETLVDQYESWIRGLEDAVGETLSSAERDTLEQHAAEAREAAERMHAGVRLLRDDAAVRQAFQLMNLAMAQQRTRQEWHRSGELGNPPSTADARWRPFQIAFILTSLRGLADADHPDRQIADLLWFPTGGGKTEAYLGIIGIAILLRRIRDPEAAGVSVLMRYTLRLLTLQQYQRATGLICALEKVRSEHLPGTAEISIGLWVGQRSTPNDVATARRSLSRAGRTGASEPDDDVSDPVQLRQCPWCGTPLDHRNYDIVDRTWMRVACRRDDCAYRNRLPVHIIDSDVYANSPSLVIGTVDKFAMLPWKREVGSLLGVAGTARGGDFHPLPPDLIVQDELHLISGPLGTMVGLYETAIDAIVEKGGARPKIVASTATIRRATAQVKAVFAREARQFPPPGLTYRDSYFAVEAPRETKASRAYAGVMAPSSSQTTLMVRVYASLLQSASVIAESDPSNDLFWTLLGYFNSLRILGGAYIQVLDDVPDQIKVIATRRNETPRDPSNVREMTSRKRSSEIPLELKILDRKRGEPDAADVVLATNMISVGVDIDRLGLMVVMGQPQLSSEYIQATSRVGRRMPGLVVTVFNSARSRDLSHYENFAAYHRMLYRHVEATGATPFAPRARDRALHAVLVSLARHRIPHAAPTGAAGAFDTFAEELEGQIDVVLDRVRATRLDMDQPPDDESEERIEAEAMRLLRAWEDSYVDHYEGWFGKWKGALLVEASRVLSKDETFAFPPEAPPWPTLTSMRDVDSESKVFLMRRRRSSRPRRTDNGS